MFRNEDCIGEELNRACLAKTTKTKTGIQYIRADIVTLKRVVNEGSRSRFTENKTVLSQFTKNKDMMKITLHGESNIYFSFHGK